MDGELPKACRHLLSVSKADAIRAVQALQSRGVIASIDVGCMQVNLVHHRQAFAIA